MIICRKLVNNRNFICFFALVLMFSFLTPYTAYATKNNNKKTVAYMENGEFWLFNKSYQALKVELKNTDFDFIYPSELYISSGWDTSKEKLLEDANKLLESEADIVIAAGTSASSALIEMNLQRKKNKLATKPILAIALADPIAAKFMKADGSSIYDFFTTEVSPEKWQSMYKVFHNIVDFKKLGIMFPDSEEGRIYGATDDAHRVAKEEGFEIIEAKIFDESTKSCEKGIKELHKKGADALFISPLVCFDWSTQNPTALLDLIHNYNMPTFARDGSLFVQGGALMGFATWDFSSSAKTNAMAIEDIMYGAKPSDIKMTVVHEPKIAINLEVAKKLNFVFPFSLLLSADEIFENTSTPSLD